VKGDLGLYGWIIFKTDHKEIRCEHPRHMWLRIGFKAVFCDHDNEPSGSIKGK
jgi:hypothetical protein